MKAQDLAPGTVFKRINTLRWRVCLRKASTPPREDFVYVVYLNARGLVMMTVFSGESEVEVPG